MRYDASGASALLTPCTRIELTTANPAVVPVTGTSVTGKLAARPPETYGGQTISTVKAPGGGVRLVLPVSC